MRPPVDIDSMRGRLDDQGSFDLGDSWAILDEVLRLRARIAILESRPTYEDGMRDGLKAAGRSCRLAELALRAKGGVETSAIGARDCALIIDEIDPGAVVALPEPKP